MSVNATRVLIDKGPIHMSYHLKLTLIKISFGNDILNHLCRIYHIRQLTTTPYTSCGNSISEMFKRTLHNLLKTLSKDRKLK